MKLITKEIERRAEKFPIGSQDGKGRDAMIIAKFFYCVGAWTWYMLEANIKNDEAFGIVINGSGEGEYGYFSLSELQNLKGFMGLGVERDKCFEPIKLGDCKEYYLKQFVDRVYKKEEWKPE